ncbi:MAG: T9SS type A sorting domain-containing protein, partial [Alcaligenaceae bacterium]
YILTSKELEVVNISSLGSGTYLFNITSDGGKTTKRIIKH